MRNSQVIDLYKKRIENEHKELEDVLSNLEVPILERYLEQFGETDEYRQYIELQNEMINFINCVMLTIKFSNALMNDSVNDRALKSLEVYNDKLKYLIKNLNDILKRFSSLTNRLGVKENEN